jgi:hypothetical protein
MDSEAARRLEEQIWELWVQPELRRRNDSGTLSPDFKLRAFQVLFASPNDGGATSVRLNEEVMATARCAFRRTIGPGDPVYARDIEAIEEITLPDQEANRAHITGLDLGGKWVTYLDLRYDRKRALAHLEAADDFLKVARYAQQERLWRPFLENLFAVVELAAVAQLLITPCGLDEERKSHGTTKRKYAEWAGLGNAPRSSSQALAKLIKLRGRARYLRGPFAFDSKRADAFVTAAIEALEWTRRRLIGEDPERQRVE